MPASKRPAVDTHPLVKALVPDPSQPPASTVKLVGLPGESPAAETTRLWLDASLTSYVDIPTGSILHAQTLPDDGGTVLWVEADAQVVYGTVTSHAAQALFLGGSMLDRHLGSAAPAGSAAPVDAGPGMTGILSVLLCPSAGCASFPVCPTPGTYMTGVLSVLLCPSAGCASFPVCPTPSVHVMCPAPSAVGGCPSAACPSIACGGGQNA